MLSLRKELKLLLVLTALALIFTPKIQAGAGPIDKNSSRDSHSSIYRDPRQPTDKRVKDLLQQMTLEEKIGQMAQIEVTRLMGANQWDRGPLNERWLKNVLADNKVGSIFSGGGSAPVPNTPRAWAKLTNTIQRYALENSRLKIPVIYGIDAVHGHNAVLGAVIYPHNIGLGATWNPALVKELAAATSTEVAATGIHWNFAPVGDLGLDLRWGRFYETYGEDPYLAGRLAAAAVEGLQESCSGLHIASTAKHFVGYSKPQSGQDRANADYSLRSLREIHLLPFEMMIEAKVAAIMPNSGTVNGVPVHASYYLLTEVLRNQMGFEGVVVSDWEDIHKLYTTYGITDNYRDAIRLSINAGVDMSMIPHDAQGFTSNLLSLVREGLVREERIDEAVGRILALKFELGLFEDPYTDPEKAEDAIFSGDRNLARRAALESLTLLKNKDRILPLPQDIKSILVTGSKAADITSQMGGWTIEWQGAVNPAEMPPAVTVLEGIKNALPNANVYYNSGPVLSETLELALKSEVVVVVAGEGAYAEGLGDNIQPKLTAEDEALIQALKKADKEIVLVLISGRPLFITDIIDDVAAVLMAYYPGTEGGNAVAQILFGSYNPSGKLPFSWPADPGQLPIWHNQWITGSYEPLYPFGHGLSYTHFSYANLTAPRQVDNNEPVKITVEVTNTGQRAGDEIVQLYLKRSYSPILPRRQQLVGFKRLYLEPGEKRTVSFQLDPRALAAIPGDVLGEAPKDVQTGEYIVFTDELTTKFIVP